MACIACADGQHVDSDGAVSCSACPTGKYSNKANQTSLKGCEECHDGKYQTVRGSTSCIICPVGKYGTPNHVLCKQCEKGRFSDKPGIPTVTDCKECPPGKYSADLAATDCKPCEVGKFVAPYDDLHLP